MVLARYIVERKNIKIKQEFNQKSESDSKKPRNRRGKPKDLNTSAAAAIVQIDTPVVAAAAASYCTPSSSISPHSAASSVGNSHKITTRSASQCKDNNQDNLQVDDGVRPMQIDP